MSKILSMLQSHSLDGNPMYGAHIWRARQQTKYPDGSTPDEQAVNTVLSGAPEKVLKLNPSGTEADTWLFVNLVGVHFIPDGNPKGRGPQRTFTFRGDQDRILRWGAKRNLLQLVVFSAAERSSFTVTLSCREAIEAAYVIHRAIS